MLHNKKRVPLRQVSRGQRREPRCSRELLYLLVSRLSVVRRLKRPRSEQGTKQTESFLRSNETEKASISKKDRQAPPTSRETRKLRSPLSRQEETSFLSRYLKKWKRAYAQEKRADPPTFKKRNLVLLSNQKAMVCPPTARR